MVCIWTMKVLNDICELIKTMNKIHDPIACAEYINIYTYIYIYIYTYIYRYIYIYTYIHIYIYIYLCIYIYFLYYFLKSLGYIIIYIN